MKHQYIVRQILYNWTRTLPIDEQSGESFVSTEDIDRLSDELISVVKPLRRSFLTHHIYEYLRNLNSKITRNKILANLFCPL